MTANSSRLPTAPASTGGGGRLRLFSGGLRPLWRLLPCLCLGVPAGVGGAELGWSIGGYAGQYYDTEPAGLVKGKANFFPQYMLALTVSKTVWRSDRLPLALEIDGTVAQQFGEESLNEVAIAPVLRWRGFPWNDTLATSVRFGPLGFSHTSEVSALERKDSGKSTRNLNFMVMELTFAPPRDRTQEVFLRLHHRCAIYDLLNNYGANGEDFLAFGYRRFF